MIYVHLSVLGTHHAWILTYNSINRSGVILSESQISAVYIACFVNILHLLGIVLVVPHVALVVVRVTNTVEFCIEPLLNFRL
jgi:hypothetical protein